MARNTAWTAAQAAKEGWCIKTIITWRVDYPRLMDSKTSTIATTDTAKFTTDEDARLFVEKKAASGSAYHVHSLEVLRAGNKKLEWSDAEIAEALGRIAKADALTGLGNS